jgi:hypothetical protein
MSIVVRSAVGVEDRECQVEKEQASFISFSAGCATLGLQASVEAVITL